MVVFPCLRVDGKTWSCNIAMHAQEIAKQMRLGRLNSLQDLNLKLGSAVSAGAACPRVTDVYPLVKWLGITKPCLILTLFDIVFCVYYHAHAWAHRVP